MWGTLLVMLYLFSAYWVWEVWPHNAFAWYSLLILVPNHCWFISLCHNNVLQYCCGFSAPSSHFLLQPKFWTAPSPHFPLQPIFWTLYSLIQSPHILTSQPHVFLDGFHSLHSLFMPQSETQRAHVEKGVEEKWANIEVTPDYFRLWLHKKHNSSPSLNRHECSGYLLTTWRFYPPCSASSSSSIQLFHQHLQLQLELNCPESVIRIKWEMNGWVRTAVFSLWLCTQIPPALASLLFPRPVKSQVISTHS